MRAPHPAEGRIRRSWRRPKSLPVEEQRKKLGRLDVVVAERWWGISGRSQVDLGGRGVLETNPWGSHWLEEEEQRSSGEL